jgi:hypothetical protein
MKKIAASVVKMTIVFVAILSLIVAVNAGQVSLQQKTETKTPFMLKPTDFYANITFKVFEGEGCECVLLGGSFINATGRDTDHLTSGVTDDKGVCVLQLQFDKTYRVSVQISDHESVLYDFNVLDDQSFTFNLKKTVTSSNPVPASMHAVLQQLSFVKKVLK